VAKSGGQQTDQTWRLSIGKKEKKDLNISSKTEWLAWPA